MALKAVEERHPFSERLAEVLDKEPSYYQLLVSTEPTRCMSDLIASLALDADPNRPEITPTLFQELGTNVPGKHMDRYPRISFSAVHRLLKRGVLSHLH